MVMECLRNGNGMLKVATRQESLDYNAAYDSCDDIEPYRKCSTSETSILVDDILSNNLLSS